MDVDAACGHVRVVVMAACRRTIYLTIMSSMQFEEAGHKLMKISIQPGQEVIMAEMIIECCSQVGGRAGDTAGLCPGQRWMRQPQRTMFE